MPTYRVNQVRSGEGWILTDPANLGPEALAGDLSDLLQGPLLIASEEFETWSPPGGEQIEAHLWAFLGEPAKAMLRDWKRWGGKRAIFACLPSLPDADATRRWLPDALRPWDAERLKATAYGQVGKDWAQQGIWFATEQNRGRFLEAAVSKLLASHGVRLPNGDVSIVLEMPTDSTFEASFKVSGSGDSFSLKRDFPSQLTSREWRVRKGEWEAIEQRTSRAAKASFRVRFLQGLATVGILVLSIPVFLLAIAVAIVAKFAGSSTTPSTAAKSLR